MEYKARQFEVKRVRCHYRFRSGQGYVMTKKQADVVEFTRAMEERWLGRVMKITLDDGGANQDA